MYFTYLFLFLTATYLLLSCPNLLIDKNICNLNVSPVPSPSCRNHLFNENNLNLKKPKIVLNCYFFHIFIVSCGVITILWLSFLNLCNHVRYVMFNTNLSTCGKKLNSKSLQCISTYLSLIYARVAL